MKKKKECSHLNHEWKNLQRKGRCSWICPKCGEDIMLILVLLHEAGISIKDLIKK